MGMDFMNKFYIKKSIYNEEDKKVFIRNIINLILNKCILYRGSLGDFRSLSYFEGEPAKPILKECLVEEAVKFFLKKEMRNLSFSFTSGIRFELDFAQWRSDAIKEVNISLRDFFFCDFWYKEGPNGKIIGDEKEGRNKFIFVIIELCKELYNFLHPFYGYGNNLEYIETQTKYEEAEAENIRSIYWSNFFGFQLVKKFGREKLLSAPSWKTEELSDGGIMLVRSPNPFTIDEPYIKAEEIEKHLGIMERKNKEKIKLKEESDERRNKARS